MDAPDRQPLVTSFPDGRLLLEGPGCRLVLGLEGPRPRVLAARDAARAVFPALQPVPVPPALARAFGTDDGSATGAALAEALLAALPEVPVAWVEHEDAFALRLAREARLRLALGGALLCIEGADGVGGVARCGPALVLAGRAVAAALAARSLADAGDAPALAERWVGRGLILGAGLGDDGAFGLLEAVLSKLDEPAAGPT
ncbi:MAG: hypothetical protein K2X11_04040 [Acetobacteraceae bacterium]|nr:hypothetical protein [Acetobacteraceae bacterium]